MVRDPDFEHNLWIYLYFTESSTGADSNATDTQAVVTGASPDTVYVVDLETGTIDSSMGTSAPWGIDFNDSSTVAYFADNAGGHLWGWDLYGGLWPIGLGLLDPTGLDVNASQVYQTEIDLSDDESELVRYQWELGRSKFGA